MNIGVIGLGAVGTAVVDGLSKYHFVEGYDIDGRGSMDQILKTDVVFITVPTDSDNHGSLDTSIVESVVSDLSNKNYLGIVVVKSTLSPRTMDTLHSRHSDLRLCYMPEYLREKDALEWFANPDRIVISGDKNDIEVVLESFSWVDEDVPRLEMSYLEAELSKLAHNAFIATKVTFTCEVERICDDNSCDPHKVMNGVWVDRRINNPAHLTPRLGGFGGKCVPKDTEALVSFDKDRNSILTHLKKRGSEERVSKIRRDRLTNNEGFLVSSILFTALIFIILFVIIDEFEYNPDPINHVIYSEGVEYFQYDRVYASDIEFVQSWNISEYSEYCETLPDKYGDTSTTCYGYTTTYLYLSSGEFVIRTSDYNMLSCLSNTCSVVGIVDYENSVVVLTWS